MLIRLLVCGLMGTARLVELQHSARNITLQAPATEGELSRRTYPLIVLLHSLVIGGTLLRGAARPRSVWLLILLAVQPLRLWVFATLGRRWNARGAVPEKMDVCTGGPYGFVRHPNYTVVAVELASLPAAFGLGRFAFAASLVNAALLTLRIRDEEAMLFRLPGYREHFESKPRFLPFLV